MKRMTSKFIALLMVFTSIISFLPSELGGLEAKAATTLDINAIQVKGNGTVLTPRTGNVTSGNIYSTEGVPNKFEISLPDARTTTGDLIEKVKQTKSAQTGYVDYTDSNNVPHKGEDIEIISINGTSWQDSTGRGILTGMGISIDEVQQSDQNNKRIGKVINGLPFGVNRIEYRVTLTEQQVVPVITSTVGTTITYGEPNAKTPVTTSYETKPITLEHGTKYVVEKVEKMIFNAYVGDASKFDPDTGEVLDSDINENNKVPFLYSTETNPDANMPLRYTFDVPDSTSTLKYNMQFSSELNLSGATLYKNGKEAVSGVDYKIEGQTLTGNLERLGQSDLIVVKLNGVQKNGVIDKAYSIEIQYNNLNADKDYSLKDAGITKADFNDDSSVLAYIGKKYNVSTNDSGFKVYNGDIYIDPRARLISIDPTLIRSKSTVAYVVTNNYLDSSGATKVEKTELKNGNNFIDFMKGSTNQIQLDVYEGDGSGNIKSGSRTVLARYLFKVHLLSGSAFTMDLAFDGNDRADDTYLTQEGVKENVIDRFSTSRRTYDLYTKDPDTVNVNFIGARSNKHEYIKVWLADTINSSNLQEAQASINNVMDSNGVRSTGLDIALGKAQKMVVQAYYDDVTKPPTTTSAAVFVSHPLGDKYVFYIPANYTGTKPGTGEDSNEAGLSSLKIKGYTLTDSQGNSGFTSSSYNYTANVAKEDTKEKITVVPQDANVQSIVATVQGKEDSYNLASGEETEITLNNGDSTTLKIVVTAQDGKATQTYTVTIKKNAKGSNANLKNVILNKGDFTFDPKQDVTKVRVDPSVSSIQVTPVPEDSKATASVNGQAYSDTPITVSLKGAQETDIDIVVKSEDGKESKTYTLKVSRVDINDWNDTNNGDKYDDDQYYDDYNNCWVDTSKYEQWGTVNGKPVYFDNKGRQVKDAWITTGGKNYYLNNLGYRAAGWKVDDRTGQTYYLDSSTGEMKMGWVNLNNKWYYMGLNGVMHKGWFYSNGKWYYFTPNGQMVVNQSMFVDDKVYNFGQDGAVIF